MQAEGEFAPGCDGWGSRGGGGGVGAGGRRSGRHGEATVAGDLAEDLTPRSLGAKGADLDGRVKKKKKKRGEKKTESGAESLRSDENKKGIRATSQ